MSTKKFIIESKTHGKFKVLIDTEDWERVSQFKWNVNKNVRNKHRDVFYIITNSKAAPKRSMKLHRYVMGCPDGMVIDHINGDTLDNRKSNLRVCTKTDNKRSRSKQSNNTLGYKGVVKAGNRYYGKIGNGKSKSAYLGSFATLEEAARAYDRAAKEKHGAFAVLNFSEEE